MYLIVLLMCGMLISGNLVLIYWLIETLLIILITVINNKRNTELKLNALKHILGILVHRFCNIIIWAIFFSITNAFNNRSYENELEKMLNYEFPPNIYFNSLTWELCIILALCIIFTLITFQINACKKIKWPYYIVLSVTTLIFFTLLTSQGVPLYWH